MQKEKPDYKSIPEEIMINDTKYLKYWDYDYPYLNSSNKKNDNLFPVPVELEGQRRMDEITGGSPYGTSTIVGPEGERMPSENEKEAARYQGRYVASIAAKLFK